MADPEHTFILSGTGDVVDPDDGVAAIGSGGAYAQAAAKALIKYTDMAAAKALIKYTDMAASEIVRESMLIASEICIYTNDKIIIEEL